MCAFLEYGKKIFLWIIVKILKPLKKKEMNIESFLQTVHSGGISMEKMWQLMKPQEFIEFRQNVF